MRPGCSSKRVHRRRGGGGASLEGGWGAAGVVGAAAPLASAPPSLCRAARGGVVVAVAMLRLPGSFVASGWASRPGGIGWSGGVGSTATERYDDVEIAVGRAAPLPSTCGGRVMDGGTDGGVAAMDDRCELGRSGLNPPGCCHGDDVDGGRFADWEWGLGGSIKEGEPGGWPGGGVGWYGGHVESAWEGAKARGGVVWGTDGADPGGGGARVWWWAGGAPQIDACTGTAAVPMLLRCESS